MTIYIVTFFILALLGLQLPDRSARQLLPWVLLLLLWFMGTRFEVGCDFTGYLNRFVSLREGDNVLERASLNEAGFEILIGSIKNSGLGYMWLNVFASAIFLILVFFFCRAHRRPMMVLALLFPIVLVQLGMSGLRQAIACAFLMAATVAFVRKSRVLTGSLIVFGALFHTSVVIFLPIAFLPGKEISLKKVIAAAVILTPLSYFFLESRVDVYVDRYVDQVYGEVSSGGALLRYALLLIPALAFIRYSKKIKAMFPDVFGLLQLFTIITFAALPLVLISTVALHRINYYIMPVSILILVYVSLAASPRRMLSFQRMAPAVMYGVYTVFWFLNSEHAAACYIPYQSYNFL